MRRHSTFRGAMIGLCLLGPSTALLDGCGGNRIIMNLDLDSFMTAEERSFDYLGVNPGGDFQQRSPVETVTTPEGLKELTQLDRMVIDVVAQLDNREVVGEVDMAVRVDVHLAASDDPAELWAQDALLLSLEGELQGGEISEIAGVFDAESSLDLFQEHDTLYLGLVFNLQHQSGLGVVNGHAEITRLHLRVEAREDLL